MKMKFYLKFIAVLLSVSILTTGCASSTYIESYPTGAKIYIDGAYAGRTPYWYTDSKIMGSVTNIDLIKEGYEPLYTSIVRSERLDLGAVFCGFYLLAPFLWSLRYNPTHSYELIPLQTQPIEPQTEIPQNPTTQPPSQDSRSLRLNELKKLRDEKTITNDDYEKQKQRILNEI
jgi:hypothetical protein